jgi:NAD(P)-dependent dehydrogenase (short-subunit alcohol dehydrogenase family)
MKIDGSVALVTGANRGLGQAFARELVKRGAARVYGAARNPAAVTEPGVTPVALDITDPERVASVAQQCADVSLLVNNAGVMRASTFIGAPNLDAAARIAALLTCDQRQQKLAAACCRSLRDRCRARLQSRPGWADPGSGVLRRRLAPRPPRRYALGRRRGP